MDIPTSEEGLNPERMVETSWLAFRWGYKSARRLEERLRTLKIELLPIGKDVTLVRLRDVWDRFDE